MADDWQEHGYLSETPHRTATAGDMPTKELRIGFLEEMRIDLANLEAFNQLARRYRGLKNYRDSFDPDAVDLYKALNVEALQNKYGFGDFEALDFDPDFLKAARRQANEVFVRHEDLGHLPSTSRSREANRKRIDQIDIPKEVEKIRFEGFDPPEGMVALITPGVVKSWMYLLPPDFLQKLVSISHSANRPARSSEDEEYTGHFFPEYDVGGDLDKANIKIYQTPFAKANAGDHEKYFLDRSFMETTWHELGHNAHNLMNYDEMQAWEKIIKEDPTNVTWYIQASKADPNVQWWREDLATTFSTFVNNPHQLFISSPSRYQFMYEFFDNRLQTLQKPTFRQILQAKISMEQDVQKKLGKTDDEMRDIYLAHERE